MRGAFGSTMLLALPAETTAFLVTWELGGESVKSMTLLWFEKFSISGGTSCCGVVVGYRALYISAGGPMLDLGRLFVDDEVVGGVFNIGLLLSWILFVIDCVGIAWE